MASSMKKKCRQYNIEYMRLGFIPSPSNHLSPMCLVCKESFSNEAMKPSRLKRHFDLKHPDKKNKDLEYFKSLKKDYFSNKTLLSSAFSKVEASNVDGLIASYNIASIIAKCGKPHSIGESLVVPIISEVLSTVLHQNPVQTIKRIPLSNDSIRRRIDEMAVNVEEKLCDILKSTEFALQIDESTLCRNQSLLLGYVRFFHQNELHEELIFALNLPTDTKGVTIFNSVSAYFKEKAIPLSNIVSCATDGARAMVGQHKGFVSLLKKENPSVFAVHCVIHRQHLAAKKLSEPLSKSLQVVINVINFIKRHALNERIFRQLCQDNDEKFVQLLLHTEVRWLSKGKCLTRFSELFDSIIEFLQGRNEDLYEKTLEVRQDCAYLADIFDKCNNLILALQGEKISFHKAKSAVTTFLAKLNFFERNLCRREFYNFPSVANIKNMVSDNHLQIYAAHLRALQENMRERFADLLQMNIPLWIADPFIVEVDDIDIKIQEEFIELQTDDLMKVRFQKIGEPLFWMQEDVQRRFPLLHTEAKRFSLPFPSSYLVEMGFGAVSRMQSKARNRFDVVSRGDLRLHLTKIKPDVKKLARLHEAQGSH